MYQCILFSASWALMKKFKGRLYPHWSMGTQYPIEFFLKDTIHLCVFSSLRSWRYCLVVEWDLAAEPLWYSPVIFDGGAVTSGKAARNTASSLLPFFGTRIFHFFYLLEFIVLQFLVWPFRIVTVWTVGVCIGNYYSAWSIKASWLAKLHVLCFSHSRTFKNPEFSLVLL